MAYRASPAPRLPPNFPTLKSYFYPKPPKPAPLLTHAYLASASSHLPAPLLDTLLAHTPVFPEPPPESKPSLEESIKKDLHWKAPEKPNPRTRPVKPTATPPPLKDLGEEYRREVKWGLLRGLRKEYQSWEKKYGTTESEGVMWGQVRTLLTAEEGNSDLGARREGGVESRVTYAREMLAALKRHRDDPGFLQRMVDRVLTKKAVLKAGSAKRKAAKPTGGPIPGGGTVHSMLTGSINLPSRLFTAHPRMKPQPHNLSMMIWSRDRKQTEAFRVMALKGQADQEPNNKELQAEVAAPLYQLHLQKAQHTIRLGRWREAQPIPPSLVVRSMSHRAKTAAWRIRKKAALKETRQAFRRELEEVVDAEPGGMEGRGVGGLGGEEEGGKGYGYGRIRTGQGMEGRVLVGERGERGFRKGLEGLSQEEVMREWEEKGRNAAQAEGNKGKK